MAISQKAYWLSALSLLCFYTSDRLYLDKPHAALIFLFTWTLFCIGQTAASLDKLFNRPNLSLDLETEAIKRFRVLVPFLPPQCRVFRELNRNSISLCLDFTDCPEALTVNLAQFNLLIVASHRLGLPESLIFKLDNQIIHKFIPT